MKKHAFDELQSQPGKRKKFYQDEINKLKIDKSLAQKEKVDAEKNVQLVANSVNSLSERLEENTAQNMKTKEQIQQAQTEIENARTEKKRVAMQVKARMFEFDEAQLAAQSLKTKLGGLESQLEKVEPIYATHRRLRAQIK